MKSTVVARARVEPAPLHDEVRVRRVGNAVVLEPIGETFDMDAWWAKIDEYRDVPFMPEGREQPPMPVDDRKYFDDE